MIYNTDTHVAVPVEQLEALFEVLRDSFPDYYEFESTNWIEPILDRYAAVRKLEEEIGERDYALSSDFYFAVRRDPTREADDDTFELYVTYKIPYLQQGRFPWEDPFGFREVRPAGLPQPEEEDNGLYWIRGDMEAARQLLLAAGFEENPEIATR